jgi:hypothetical protein
LGAGARPTGKVYILKYRDAVGRQRRVTLGKHGEVTAEQARRQGRGRTRVGLMT